MSTFYKTNNDDNKKDYNFKSKKKYFQKFFKYYIVICIFLKYFTTQIVQIKENDCFSWIDGGWKIVSRY